MVEVQQRAGARRRTQVERTSATKASLLDAAARAVVATGPSTPVAAIAKRAGVSTGALQYHFASKADLLVAIVEHGWDELVVRSASIRRDEPVTERVAALVSTIWEAYCQPPARAAFMISSDPNADADIAARISTLFTEARSRLDQIWTDTFADLDGPAERITSARRFARSHLNGMVVQRQMRSIEPDPDEELDMLRHAIVHILTAPPAR